MSKLKLIETIQTKLPTLSKTDGQLIVVRDNASLYVDLDGNRIYISDWIDVSTETDRLAMLTPLSNKYYYVIETNKIWRYIGGSWFSITKDYVEDTRTIAGINLKNDITADELIAALGVDIKAEQTDLDTLASSVAYLSNENDVISDVSTVLTTQSIVDDLNSLSSDLILSANQGRILNDKISNAVSNNEMIIDEINNIKENGRELFDLENVDNTSDIDKPISTATQNELDKKVNQIDFDILSDSVAYLSNENDIVSDASTILTTQAIVDDLNSSSNTMILSANQGRVLNDNYNVLSESVAYLSDDEEKVTNVGTILTTKNIVDNVDSSLSNMVLSAKQGKMLNERISNIISHNNETDGNTELLDIRVSADGNTHYSAGDAIRSQINIINSEIDEMGYKLNPNDFERGAWDGSKNEFVALDYRVISNVKEAQTDFKLSVKNGFEYIVYKFVGNTCTYGEFTTDVIEITKGTMYRIGIRRKPQDTSEVANIEEFVASVTVFQECATKEFVDKSLNDIYQLFTVENDVNENAFSVGAINHDGTHDANVSYRVCTPNTISFSSDTVIKCHEGWRNYVVYYENGVVSHRTELTNEDKTVKANEEIQIVIGRSVDNTSETASVSEFVSGIYLVSMVTSSERLSGKKMCIVGDSYVAYDRTGTNYDNITSNIKETWHYKLAQKYGMTYKNYGWSGNPLIDNSDVASRGEPVINRYSAMDNDTDYVVVIGGKNDYNTQISLADFRSGLERLCKGLVDKYIGKKICFFTPWRVPQETIVECDSAQASATIPLIDYVETIVEVCKKYSIPCFDTKDSEMYIFNSTFRSKYMKSVNDVSHLNGGGHDLMLPKGESFMLKL